jgi:hypothetical protein
LRDQARLVVGAVAALSLLLVSSPGAASGDADAVTMHMSMHTTSSNVTVFDLSGVAGRSRGRLVEVLRRDCGESGFRLLGADRTRAGGKWRVEYPPELNRVWKYPPIHSGTTLRARSRGRLSAAVVYKSGAPMTVSGVVGTLTRTVHVLPAASVSLRGKVVLLQQLQRSSWVTIREARLSQVPSVDYGPLNHEATFRVRLGWTLRSVLPARSAAPCYRKSVTEPFRVW